MPGRHLTETKERLLHSPEIIRSITIRGVKEIISLQEFVRLLETGDSLRLKMGFERA